MPRYTIEDLPTEILSKIFSYVSEEDKSQESPNASIENLRLASSRLKQVASAFLIIDPLTISLTTTSFDRLEGICLHSSPDFRKSITRVTIDLSYYEVSLAENLKLFGENFARELSQDIQFAEDRAEPNTVDDYEILQQDLEQLWDVLDDLKVLDRFEDDDSSATIHQKNLMNLHREYVRFFADQESLRLGNHHVQRIVAALNNLPLIDSIFLAGAVASKYYEKTHVYLLNSKLPTDHPEFFISALVRTGYSGTHMATKISPPTEMLGELLSSLGNAGLRPRSLTLWINIPLDTQFLRPTQTQSAGIQRLVSQSSNLDLHLTRCEDKPMNRPLPEMLPLSTLITALTSTSTLQHLSLVAHDFFLPSDVSLLGLLPIHSVPWLQLSSIELTNIAYDLEDLIAFVDTCRETIKSFVGKRMYLRAGFWDKALDVLRELKMLKHFTLERPCGGLYSYSPRPYPREKAEGYVLGTVAENPMLSGVR